MRNIFGSQLQLGWRQQLATLRETIAATSDEPERSAALAVIDERGAEQMA